MLQPGEYTTELGVGQISMTEHDDYRSAEVEASKQRRKIQNRKNQRARRESLL